MSSRLSRLFAHAKSWIHAATAAASLLVAQSLFAFTPESGFWWNANEGGRGYAIEIQDNYLFFAGFLFAPDGTATWYTSQGLISADSRSFTGQLNATSGGQCINCNYVRPTTVVGAAGNMTIVFDSEISGRIIWGSPARTVPITRFDYYFTRTIGDQRNDRMRGRWDVVLDYIPPSGGVGEYYGDVLVFNRVDRSSTADQSLGCRITGFTSSQCSTAAFDASGFYQASDGNHYLVVENTASTFVVYVVRMNYNDFEGVAKVCSRSVLVSSCLNNSSIRSAPVRGSRSASFSFVNTGSGPNSSPNAKSAETRAGLKADGGSLSNDEVKARFNIDLSNVPDAELQTAVQSLAD